jgi:hypothetical protein
VSVNGTPNPSFKGNPVTISVTVSGTHGTPTGTVTITDGSGSPPDVLGTVTLSGGTGSLAISSLQVGNHTIWALYNGNVSYPAASSYYIQAVTSKYTPVMDITSSDNPSFFGQEFTLTVTVSPPTGVLTLPTGTVALTDSIMGDLGVYALPPSGIVQWTMDPSVPWSPGAHLVTASYSGDIDYIPGIVSLVQLVIQTGCGPHDVPGFALIASYSPKGDENLPAWAVFSADPSTVLPGEAVYLLWTSTNIVSVRMSGDNGLGDSLDTGVLSTTGSGIYAVSGGFQHTIVLECLAYDSSGSVAASQLLTVTVSS